MPRFDRSTRGPRSADRCDTRLPGEVAAQFFLIGPEQRVQICTSTETPLGKGVL
jgi:hypothetical protein